MFKIEFRGDTALIAKYNGASARVQLALQKEISTIILKLERHIKADKLSGQVLNVRSGNLRRSIHARLPVEVSGPTVTGKVGQSGDIKYGAIHEFGGTTPAHVIEAKRANVLAFVMGGKTVFAKRVNHPGSKMPQRSYMRTGLADMRDEIATRISGAVKRGITTT